MQDEATHSFNIALPSLTSWEPELGGTLFTFVESSKKPVIRWIGTQQKKVKNNAFGSMKAKKGL